MQMLAASATLKSQLTVTLRWQCGHVTQSFRFSCDRKSGKLEMQDFCFFASCYFFILSCRVSHVDFKYSIPKETNMAAHNYYGYGGSLNQYR
jgi:hypothetical protein